jgi:predicted SnoaL-like aldol condensation-catalyzing enzyme
MSKQEIAKAFLRQAAAGKVVEAFERYVALDFIHHNQYFRGDRQSLLRAMQEDHQQNPNLFFEIKQCFADGEHVITHSLVVKKDLQIAVVHIFKLREQKIVELWDLGQVMEADSPNENGPF